MIATHTVALAQNPATAPVFVPWTDLIGPADRDRWSTRFAVAYPVGLIVGLLWGGWKGAVAGALAVAASGNAVAASVYGAQGQVDPYPKVTWLSVGLGAIEGLVAVWLASKVAHQKDDDGRSLLSLAR